VGQDTKRQKDILLGQLETGVQMQEVWSFKGHQRAGFQQCSTTKMVVEIA